MLGGWFLRTSGAQRKRKTHGTKNRQLVQQIFQPNVFAMCQQIPPNNAHREILLEIHDSTKENSTVPTWRG